MGRHTKGAKCATPDCHAMADPSRDVCKRCHNAAYYRANPEKVKTRVRAFEKKRKAELKRYQTEELGRVKVRAGHNTTSRYIALQALSSARIAEQRITDLMVQLGMTAPVLPRDPGSVLVLLDDMMRPVEYIHAASPDYVRYWGGVFYGLDESYLEAVGLLLEDKEPWRVFCDFANRLLQMLGTKVYEAVRRSSDLQLAAKYFIAARNHLLHAAYFLCRRLHGGNIADGVFGGKKPSAVSEIYTLARASLPIHP